MSAVCQGMSMPEDEAELVGRAIVFTSIANNNEGHRMRLEL
jgi:hypothetical protein